MAQDTLLGFPAHTLPFRRGEFTTLLTDCEKAPEGCLFFFGKRTFHAFFVCFAHSQRKQKRLENREMVLQPGPVAHNHSGTQSLCSV